MTRTKHLFNLVELVLAIGVAAIGITSILGLIPVAVKSTSDSVGDTLSADAVNTIMTLIDQAVEDDFSILLNTGNFKKYSEQNPRYKWYDNPKLQDSTVVTLPANSSYKTIPENIISNGGAFKFYFGPEGKTADFAAEVRMWRDDTYKQGKQVTTFDGNSNTMKFIAPTAEEGKEASFARLVIEISWPLSRPYCITGAKDGNGKGTTIYPRNSRIFVRDYFDPRFAK